MTALSRKRIQRALLALAAPVLFVFLLEAVLRLAGFGFPTSFVVPYEIGGRNVFIDNQFFGYRFFPMQIARAPQAIVTPANKPADTVRIVVLGESAAMGEPAQEFGLPRMLESILRARFPGQNIEVINAAMTAINSHVIRGIAEDIATLKPDFFVVYMGNNEVVGPYGPGTIFDPFEKSGLFIRTSILFGQSRIGQWIRTVHSSYSSSAQEEELWRGIQMFMGKKIEIDDPRLEFVYRHFRNNLDAILHTAEKTGATTILSTVGVNLRRGYPFLSTHRKDLSVQQLNDWESFIAQAKLEQNAKREFQALDLYRKAEAIDDRHAELAYRKALCEDATGSAKEADASFQAACDLDVLRFRADSRINTIIRNTAAAQSDAVHFVDGELVLRTNAVVEKVFLDHVHLTFTGNYLLACLMSDSISDVLAARLGQSPAPTPDLPTCTRALAYTVTDEAQIARKMNMRFLQPPFKTRPDARELTLDWQAQYVDLIRQQQRMERSDRFNFYRDAMALRPDDWVMHSLLAQRLYEIAEFPAAEEQLREAVRLVPHRFDVRGDLATILCDVSNTTEAVAIMNGGLPEKGHFYNDICGNIGVDLIDKGRTQDGMKFLAETAFATRGSGMEPITMGGFTRWQTSRIYIRMGSALARRNQPEEAVKSFMKALELEPEYADAYYQLGLLDVRKKDWPSAANYFERAVKFSPDYAPAFYSLGQVYKMMNRSAAARHNFDMAVLLAPDRANYKNDLAWFLATDPNDSVRDGPQAVRLASDACMMSGFRQPLLIDTLAAAYAEVGQFDLAVTNAMLALNMMASARLTNLTADIRKRLELYTAHQPYRESSPPSP